MLLYKAAVLSHAIDPQSPMLPTGAHTLGRCRPERSGFGKPVTKYTANGPGSTGGSPWTPDWITFSNTYYKVRISCPLHSAQCSPVFVANKERLSSCNHHD